MALEPGAHCPQAGPHARETVHAVARVIGFRARGQAGGVGDAAAEGGGEADEFRGEGGQEGWWWW